MGWYEAVKDVIVVADRLRDSELKQKLATVQVECAKLAEENAQLRQERNELRDQLNARDEMVFGDNVYWREPPTGAREREGPFCPRCHDGSRRTARMVDDPEDDDWRCSVYDFAVQKPGKSTEAALKFRRRLDSEVEPEY